MYHYPMMAINYQSAQEANARSKKQRDVIKRIQSRNTKYKYDSRYTQSARKLPKENDT